MRFQAKGRWVIVTRAPLKEGRVGSIILVHKEDETIFTARVSSVGEELEDMKLHVGDSVLVANYDSKKEIGANKAGRVYAVEAEDILCSVEDDDDDNQEFN